MLCVAIALLLSSGLLPSPSRGEDVPPRVEESAAPEPAIEPLVAVGVVAALSVATSIGAFVAATTVSQVIGGEAGPIAGFSVLALGPMSTGFVAAALARAAGRSWLGAGTTLALTASAGVAGFVAGGAAGGQLGLHLAREGLDGSPSSEGFTLQMFLLAAGGALAGGALASGAVAAVAVAWADSDDDGTSME